MSPTSAPTQRSTTRVRRIVLDRPPFGLKRFIVYTALGLVIGFVLGWLLSWVERPGRGVSVFHEQFGYLLPLTVLGLGGGMLFGWSWGREVTPRPEMVELPVTTKEERRRARRSVRSTTTEILRY